MHAAGAAKATDCISFRTLVTPTPLSTRLSASGAATKLTAMPASAGSSANWAASWSSIPSSSL